MADGSSYEIDTVVRSVGVKTSADELNGLADALDAAAHVSTSFDAAIARTQTLLADATSNADAAASAVAEGASKYRSLEMAALRASKALDKATQGGKDTSALKAKADEAAAALSAQGTALDELKSKSASASAAQVKLASTLKSIEAAAKGEAAAMKTAASAAQAESKAIKSAGEVTAKATEHTADAGKKAEALGRTVKGLSRGAGPYIEQVTNLAKGIGTAGLAGGFVVAGVAAVAMTSAVILGVAALAKMAIAVNKVAQAKLDKLATKAKKDWADLFAGVHVDKFVAGLTELEKSLTANTSEGRALKDLISTLLNPLFDGIPKVVPLIRQLFRGFVLGALLAGIAALKFYILVRNMIPESVKTALKDTASNIDWMTTALYAGAIAVGVVAVALGILTAILIVLAVAIASPFILGAAVIAVVAAGVYGAIQAFVAFKAWVSAVATQLSNFAAMAWSAAASLIDGLVGGIKSGAGLVMQALKDLAKNAIATLKSALQSHSPSKLTLEIGEKGIAGGVAEGTKRGRSAVSSAMANLVDPEDIVQPSNASGAPTGGGGPRLSFDGATFVFEGVKDAEQAEGRFGRMLTRLIEGDVTALGGETEPAT